jgi:hypothetical protein
MVLLLLALAFTTSAAIQGFLAASMSEWWPAAVAACLALAGVCCLAGATWGGHERGRHPR